MLFWLLSINQSINQSKLLPWLNWTDGAGLIYTSVKEEKNLDLIYKYIVHKVYDFPFTTPALVVEKDAVFM